VCDQSYTLQFLTLQCGRSILLSASLVAQILELTCSLTGVRRCIFLPLKEFLVMRSEGFVGGYGAV
jgi:hypothetical protein